MQGAPRERERREGRDEVTSSGSGGARDRSEQDLLQPAAGWRRDHSVEERKGDQLDAGSRTQEHLGTKGRAWAKPLITAWRSAKSQRP